MTQSLSNVNDTVLEQILERIKLKLIKDINSLINTSLISKCLKSKNNQLADDKNSLTTISNQNPRDKLLSNIKDSFRNYSINMSTREVKYIVLCPKSKTAKDIRKILNISHRTVRTHFEKSYIKLSIITKAKSHDLTIKDLIRGLLWLVLMKIKLIYIFKKKLTKM